MPSSFDPTKLFIQSNPATLLGFLGAIVASVVLAIAMDFIFRVYTARTHIGIGINKSFKLIAPAVTTIFLVIQFSLPLSLGLLGALSFVRFRTPIKEPEEIGFILITIGTSLCCAVFRFDVAFILTLVVAAIASSRYAIKIKRPLLQAGKLWDLFITTTEMETEQEDTLRNILHELRSASLSPEVVSVSTTENTVSYHFKVGGEKKTQLSTLLSDLKKVPSVSAVNLICQSNA